MNASVALNKSGQRKFSKKVKKIKTKLQSGEITVNENPKGKFVKKQRGVIYIGHIPHGFYEKEMDRYFRQFGRVTNVLHCRSLKTGRSRGFGFIEFMHPEVAKVAAETMNNYLMFKRRLVASYIPPEKQKPYMFKGRRVTERHIPKKIWRDKVIKRRNENVDEVSHKKECVRTLSKLRRKLNALKELGIEHDVQPVDVPKEVLEKTANLKPGVSEKKVKVDDKSEDVDEDLHKKERVRTLSKLRRNLNVLKELGIEHDIQPTEVLEKTVNLKPGVSEKKVKVDVKSKYVGPKKSKKVGARKVVKKERGVKKGKKVVNKEKKVVEKKKNVKKETKVVRKKKVKSDV